MLLKCTEDLSTVEVKQSMAKTNVVLDELKLYLVLAHNKMKQYPDNGQKGCEVPGDLVYLKF